MSRDLDTILERAPDLARRVRARTRSDDPAAIVAAAREELAEMTEAERISVLEAHPRIGADPRSLSALSRAEQGTSDDASAYLGALNDEYERKFGFRFVVFVNGRPRGEIVEVLRRRLTRTRTEELATGVEEFLAITQDRLRRAST